MSLTVKVYLEKGSGQPEIRRFSVDQEVASNIEYLTSKIRGIFPDLGAKKITLYWKDPDNDLVVFSTDDELTDALGYVNDGLFKVHVKVSADKESSDTVHPRVQCDGCESAVVGCRYKCLICPDFDLCEACQTKGLHSEHNMMCIRTPEQYHDFNWAPGGPHHGGPGSGPPGWCKPPFCGPFGGTHRGPPGPTGGPPGSPGPGGQRWQGPPHRFFKRMFREHMKNYANYAKMYAGMSQDAASDKEESDTGTASDTQKECGKESTQEQQQQQQQQSNDDYLRNVHESMSAILDPLGIDVSIDVQPGRGHHRRRWGRCGGRGGRWRGGWGHCGPWFGSWQAQQQRWCNDASHPQQSSATTEKAADVEMSANEPSECCAPPQEDATCCTAESAAEQMKKGDCCGGGACNASPCSKSASWTFVENPQSPMATDECSMSPKRDDQPSTPKGNDSAGTPSAPEQSDLVASSLQRMKEMGFTDESGWLTHLLQMKNGSIEQVLEIIQPKK